MINESIARAKKRISSCLQSGKTSILVNGSPTQEFEFKRSVKQDDQLSSYLFIIAMEELNLIIKKAMENNNFKGIQLSNQGPSIPNVFYLLENGMCVTY
ncbi:hypothetical protein HanIR_Chr09g0413531 [Helianthus annuus]|nr:hypothetical protein HanIR_Chr09g0413531 [Helianthus annuus]